jgi:hypothetical protein
VAVDPVALSVPTDADARLQLPLQARPPEQAPDVAIEVDGQAVGEVPAPLHRRLAPAGSQEAELGRAIVDGAYAALRAGAATGSLR